MQLHREDIPLKQTFHSDVIGKGENKCLLDRILHNDLIELLFFGDNFAYKNILTQIIR